MRDGAIGLDEFLGVHLPLQPALGAVTVGRGLDMTGGLPDAVATQWLLGVPPSTTLDHRALLDFLQRVDALNFRPGSEISCSNTGYRLVQMALEAHGIDIADAFQERFFRPLGLGIRMPYDEAEPVPDLAGGYWNSEAGWRHGRYGPHVSASGGLAGSGQDLAIWLQALMTGRAPAEGLLPRLAHLRQLADGKPTGYGLGLARFALGRRVLIGHGGSLPGFKIRFPPRPRRPRRRRRGQQPRGHRRRRDRAAGDRGPASDNAPGAGPRRPARGPLAMPGTPFWITQAGARSTWLGAKYPLPAEDGDVVGRSAHLAVRLRQADGAIEGRSAISPAASCRCPPTSPPTPAGKAPGSVRHRTPRLHVAVRGGTAVLTSAPARC